MHRSKQHYSINSWARAMSASGYADLMAKVTAGADWIIADALGVEPIHQRAWATVQSKLRPLLADPAGVQAGKWEAIEQLTAGLLVSGLAMQQMESSRCASGAITNGRCRVALLPIRSCN